MASFRTYLYQNTEVVVVGFLGLFLVVIGAGLASRNGYTQISTILISVGASLIAAAMVTYLSPVSREVYQKFVGLGIDDVYPSRDEIPKKNWIVWLRRAKRRCVLLGIANNNWCGDKDFEPCVLKALRSGVELKIMFLDPNGQAAAIREREDGHRRTADTIRSSIKVLWEIRAKVDDQVKAQSLLKLYVYDATPSSGMTWVDDSFMVVTHYLAGFANVTSPALIVKSVESDPEVRDLYRTYGENAEKMLEHAVLLSPDNIANYLPKEEVNASL